MHDTLQQQTIHYIVRNFHHFTAKQIQSLHTGIRHEIIELNKLMQLTVNSLIARAINHKDVALTILSHEMLYAKLGSYDTQKDRETATGSYHFFQLSDDFSNGHNLFTVASSHEVARSYVLSQQEVFKARLSTSQWQQLVDKSYIAEQEMQWRYSLIKN
jgi:hypothetical protein